jgi:hypothetical protein
MAKLLAASGADIVVGTHAHVPLGDGFIGKTYIHFGWATSCGPGRAARIRGCFW